MMVPYLCNLAVMSLLSFVLYALDKHRAVRGNGRGRVPEIVLLMITALGGALGTLIGTSVLHHKSSKSRKWYFHVTLVLSCVAQAAGLLASLGVLPWILIV